MGGGHDRRISRVVGDVRSLPEFLTRQLVEIGGCGAVRCGAVRAQWTCCLIAVIVKSKFPLSD